MTRHWGTLEQQYLNNYKVNKDTVFKLHNGKDWFEMMNLQHLRNLIQNGNCCKKYPFTNIKVILLIRIIYYSPNTNIANQ